MNSDLPHQAKVDKIALFIQNLDYSNSIGAADCSHDLGYQWYYKNWVKSQSETDLENAIIYTSLAIDLKRKIEPLDTISLRRSMYNLGFFLKQNGKLFESINTYGEITTFYLEDDFEGYAKNDLGLLLVETGEYKAALDHFRDAVIFSEKIGEQWELSMLSYINIADCYGRMGYVENKDSLEYYIDKAKILVEKKKLSDSFEDKQLKILEGNLFLRTKRYQDGADIYKDVLKSEFREFSVPEIVYNNLGFCQLKAGDTIQSKKNLLKSIELDSTYSDPRENLGDLYLEKENFLEAMKYYQKAVQLATGKNEFADDVIKLPDSETLELTRNKLSLLNHLTAKANGWLRYYKYDTNTTHLSHALATFKKADELIDAIKSENTEFQSKVYWRGKSSDLYTKAIETCFLLNRPREAFHFMERNKALLLLEDLTQEDAKQIAQIPNEKAQLEFDLKRAIFLSENQLQENLGRLNNDSLTILKQTVRNHKYNYKKFIDSLENTYPDYAKFKKKVNVLTFENLKANYISENKATLHYILNEEDGYGLLTTADTTELFPLEDISNLNEDVENLITALSNGVSDMGDFKVISNTVFNNLFPKNVYDKIKGKQLTIIPDYTLQQIPFESLVVDSDELRYLFQDVEISYAYSASLLAYNQKSKKEENPDFFGIAPIDFDSLELPELYFSENEVKSIASVFPAKTLFNGQASKTNFIENADDYSIIHLATHADVGDGDNPWIAFNDSKMYLKEIYATKNKADMVVLSACNTSSGELKRGEGVMSLARGFFYSGAKSVVSTLWPVADEAGKDILINFYKNLARGDSKSRALQKAKLDYLKNTEEEELKHPYYWAGFVVLGDNSPVSDKPISLWLLAGLGLLGTRILVFGYKKIKAHRAAA